MNSAMSVAPMALILATILAGILFNNSRTDRLEARMDKRFDELISRIDRMQADMIQLFRELGKHDARLDNLEKK